MRELFPGSRFYMRKTFGVLSRVFILIVGIFCLFSQPGLSADETASASPVLEKSTAFASSASAVLETPSFRVVPRSVFVPEGEALTLQVSLSADPGRTVQGEIVRLSGSEGLGVTEGGTFTIPDKAWSLPVTVRIESVSDADRVNDAAVFCIRETEEPAGADRIEATTFTATQLDRDAGRVVTGAIVGNTVWGETSGTYEVQGAVEIAAGAKLTILPGVLVQLAGSDGKLVCRGELDAEGAIFLGSTNALPDASRKNLIQLAPASRAVFEGCTFIGHEVNPDWEADWEQWSAVIAVESDATLTVKRCAFESDNVGDYRTPYGVYSGSGSSVTIQAGCGFRGFRAGVRWVADASLAIESGIAAEFCEGVVCLGGDQQRDARITGSPVRILGHSLNQKSGTLVFSNCPILADTFANSNNVPIDGLVVGANGRIELRGGSLTVVEQSAEWNNWDWRDAAVDLDGGSLLVDGCQLRCDNTSGLRTKYGIMTDPNARLEVRNASISGFRAAINWTPDSDLSAIASTVVFSGNEYDAVVSHGGTQSRNVSAVSLPIRLLGPLKQTAGTLKLSNCQIEADTWANRNGVSQDGLEVAGSGRVELRWCSFKTFEQSASWNDWAWPDAAIDLDGGSLLVDACQFVCDSSSTSQRTQYAIMTAPAAQAQVSGSQFSGFRAPIRWEVNSELSGIASNVIFSGNEYNAVVSPGGIQTRNVEATKLPLHLFSQIRQTSGTLKLTTCTLEVETWANRNNASVDGLVLEKTGRVELRGCSVTTLEQSESWNNWAWQDAAVDMDGGSLLVTKCQFRCDTGNGRQTKYALMTAPDSEVSIEKSSFGGFLGGGIAFLPNADLAGVGTQLTTVDDQPVIRARGGVWTRDVTMRTLDVYFDNAPCIFNGATLTVDNSILRSNFATQSQKKFSALRFINGGRAEITESRLLGYEWGDAGDGTSSWSAFMVVGNDAGDTSTLALRNSYLGSGRIAGEPAPFYGIVSHSRSSVEITDSLIHNNHCALYFDRIPASVALSNNEFQGNTLYAVRNTGPSRLTAFNNWWGSPTGPRHSSNPGGVGDPVSNYVDYAQFKIENPGTATWLLNPVAGQETSNLFDLENQTGVELMGFRVKPGEIQLEQLVFRLQDRLAGDAIFDWNKLRNFRLLEDTNGNGNVDSGETRRVGGTPTLVARGENLYLIFGQPFSSQKDSAKGYILLADAQGLSLGDAFIVQLMDNNSRIRTPLFGADVSPVYHYFMEGKVVLSDPSYGQFGDDMTGWATQNAVRMLGLQFRSPSMTVNQVVFHLSEIAGLMPDNFLGFELVQDTNHNGLADVSETVRVSDSDFQMDYEGGTGTLVFKTAVPANGDYLLMGRFRFLGGDEKLMVSVGADDITVQGDFPVDGQVTPVRHAVESPTTLGTSPQWFPETLSEVKPRPGLVIAGFLLQPPGREVLGLRLDLRDMVGVQAGDLGNALLCRDLDEDGVLDAGSDVILATGKIEVSDTTGTIRFSKTFTPGEQLANGSVSASPFALCSYLIVVDWLKPQAGDEFSAALRADGVLVSPDLRVTGDLPWTRWVVPGGEVTDGHMGLSKWALDYRSPGGRMCAARFNHAGDRVIIGYDTGSAWVFDADTNTPQMMLKDHSDQIRYAGFSADDAYAVTVTRDGVLNTWGLEDGKRTSFYFSDMTITAAEPSPDLKDLLVISQDKAILLDVETQRRNWEFSSPGYKVLTATFSPNGQYVLLGASDRFAYLLDRYTGSEIRRYAGHSDVVTAVQFTGDSAHFITGSSTLDFGTVNLWQLDGTILRTISTQGQVVQGAAVSDDGSRIALVTGVDQAKSVLNSSDVAPDPVQGIKVVNPANDVVRLRIYGDSVDELYSIPLYSRENLSQFSRDFSKPLEHWNKYLGSLCFDRQTRRVLVTSYDYLPATVAQGYPDNKQLIESADNACFRLSDGRFLRKWGLDGAFQDTNPEDARITDFRPRMSVDGNRIFCMTDHGLTLLPRTPGKPIHNTTYLNQMQGFDISRDGVRAAWMKNLDTAKNPYAEDELCFSLASDEGGFTCLIQKPWPHPTGQKHGDYNMLSLSPNGSFLAAGDRLYSMLTGEQFSNFATVNREYRSGFTRDGKYWGFTMGSPSSAVRTMRTLDKNATLYNIINTLDVAASPFKMLYHPDGRQMAVVFETVGVRFYDMPTYKPGILCPFEGKINDAALSDDGTLLLIAGGNTVRLYDTKTGRVLRSFYAQHANVRDTQAIAVQFGEHDNQILIGWGYNYVEVFKRIKPVSLTITPSERILLPQQSQAYRFGMTLEDGTVLDVTPEAGTENTTFSLRVLPVGKASVRDNVVTVAPGASGDFTVRAVYKEAGLWLEAQAHVTIGENPVAQLEVSPSNYSVPVGVFRPFFYTARYSDGYQEDVTDRVTLNAADGQNLTIVGNQVKVNPSAPSGTYTVTGTFSDGKVVRSVESHLTAQAPGTVWGRFAVTGGGDGLSGAYSPDHTRLALGFGSGGVSLYQVASVPSYNVLERTFVAHSGAVRAAVFCDNQQLLTAGEDGTLRLWNVDDPTTPVLTCYHEAPVTAAAGSGMLMAFGDTQGNVGLFNAITRQVVWKKKIHTGAVRSLALDATSVLSGGEDATLALLNGADGRVVHSLTSLHSAPVVAVGFGSTSDAANKALPVLYSVSQDKSAVVLKRADAAILQQYTLPETPTAAMMVGGELQVATKNPPCLWVYDSKSGSLLRMFEIAPQEGEIARILAEPTGKYFLTGRRSSLSRDSVNFGLTTNHLAASDEVFTPSGSFQFWESSRGLYRDSVAHTKPLVDMRVVGNDRLFTQCEKRTFQWNFDPLKQVTSSQRILESAYFSKPVYSGLDVTGDGELLAIRLMKSIYLYDTVLGQTWDALELNSESGPFALSPQGQYLGAVDTRTRLWNLANFSQLGEDVRKASSLDFRGSFLTGVVTAGRQLCLWNQQGRLVAESATQHFPLKVLVSDSGACCAVVSYEKEQSGSLSRYSYYVEVFDSSDAVLNNPLQGRPVAKGTPLLLFSTPWGLDGEFMASEWELALASSGKSLLVGPGGASSVCLPAGLRSARLYKTDRMALEQEFYPSNVPSQLAAGLTGAGFSKDGSVLAVAWRDGYAELYRRDLPASLELGLVETGSSPQAEPVYGSNLEVFQERVYDLQARLRYADQKTGEVTGATAFRVEPAGKATITGHELRLSSTCQYGDTLLLTGEFQDSTRTLQASATLHVTVPTGVLRVTLLPAEVVQAGARWRLTSEEAGVWHGVEETLTCGVGLYTLEFKDVTGWTKPASQQVTILQNQTTEVSALYVQEGTCSLTVLSEGAGTGSVTKKPALLNYPAGTLVALVADPSTSSTFAGWSGDVPADQVQARIIMLTMDANKVVTVHFDVARYRLNVGVAGEGSVVRNPEGDVYAYGTTVTLTVAPAVGQVFKGWFGDVPADQTLTQPLTIVMDSTRTLLASFGVSGKNTLTVTQTGEGTVGRAPDQSDFDTGDSVVLTAVPAEGWKFSRWTGNVPADKETVNPLTLTIGQDTAVEAVFERILIPLTVKQSGTGKGTVLREPDQVLYPFGTQVRLVASPNEGSCFLGWSGDVPEGHAADNPLVLNLDTTRTITALFDLRLSGSRSIVATQNLSTYLITVSWSAVPSATHYQLFRADLPEGKMEAITPWIPDLKFYDDTVVSGCQYRYWVVAARDSQGTSPGVLAGPAVGSTNPDSPLPEAYRLTAVNCVITSDSMTSGLKFSGCSLNSTIKIDLYKGAWKPDTDTVRYYRNVTEIPLVEVEGDLLLFQSSAPIHHLLVSGYLKSLSARGGVRLLEAGRAGTIKVEASKNARAKQPTFARTDILTRETDSLIKQTILLKGGVLENLNVRQPVTKLAVATKCYRDSSKVKTISVGGIGALRLVEPDVLSGKAAVRGAVYDPDTIRAPSIQTIQVTGGPILSDLITGQMNRISVVSSVSTVGTSRLVCQGNLRVSWIVCEGDLNVLEARARRLNGKSWVGGKLGYPDQPDLMRVLADNIRTRVTGDGLVSGIFRAGYDRTTEQPLYTGFIRQIQTRYGELRGEAHVSLLAPLIKFVPGQGSYFAVYREEPVE